MVTLHNWLEINQSLHFLFDSCGYFLLGEKITFKGGEMCPSTSALSNYQNPCIIGGVLKVCGKGWKAQICILLATKSFAILLVFDSRDMQPFQYLRAARG